MAKQNNYITQSGRDLIERAKAYDLLQFFDVMVGAFYLDNNDYKRHKKDVDAFLDEFSDWVIEEIDDDDCFFNWVIYQA